MPGIAIKSTSTDFSTGGHKSPTVTAHVPRKSRKKPKSLMSPTMEQKHTISFLPPQMDGSAGTSTRAVREDPLRLLLRDCGVLVSMIGYLPWVVLPFRTDDKGAELHFSLRGIRNWFLQVSLILFQTLLLFAALPALILLPGGAIAILMLLSYLIICALSWPMQGPRVVYSNLEEGSSAPTDFADERWLFFNGCWTR